MTTSGTTEPVCRHLDQIRPVRPDGPDGCPECLATGDAWVHLRQCQICGHVGCCDSSRNRHASAHHAATGHPVIRSYEPGEGWWWCYADQVAFDIEGAPPARVA
ncbi:UBP-type zinc finger domain-containing protein [Streptomyces sp. NPDC003023]|uniref:UBP-type zinc finger domain-containing protein n=1 Tax=Streptomyces sp. NPDC003023 TaxID=3364675 RepID=UPI0036884164